MTVTLIGAAQRYVGVAADTKPTTGVSPGATFLERDTGRTYVYDGAAWGPLSGSGYASGMVSVTRPSNTDAYTAGDVVGATAAAITFPTMGPSGGGEVIITTVQLERDVTAVISGETTYTLHLYSVTPPSALADNAAFDLPSGDRASYRGLIYLGAPVDLGSTLYVEQNGVNKQVTLASGSLYGYLVTAGGYTPASAAVFRIGLHSVAV